VRKRLVAAAIALGIAAAALALDIPPKPTAWVTDNAGILTAEQRQSLNEKLEALKQKTGAEFLVMIFPSLDGEDVVGYTNRVAEQWKVKDDKGLMLFVFPNDRKMYIQVGYGLEPVITDAYSSRVYRETLVPARNSAMPQWQTKLFIRLYASALEAAQFYRLPPGRVVELGSQTEI